MKKISNRNRAKIKIRKHITGTAERPRLTVYRSLNNIYAQLIDDSNGVTLVSVSSLSKDLSGKAKSAKGKIEPGKMVGKMLAEKAAEKNIKSVVFDRNGYKYHGRVKALADGAREGGLIF